MNEREKLLKQFNDNYEMKTQEYSDVKPYRATTNLNTALNQPNMNVFDATKVNIDNNGGISNNMGINGLMKSASEGVSNVPSSEQVPTQMVNPSPSVTPSVNNPSNNNFNNQSTVNSSSVMIPPVNNVQNNIVVDSMPNNDKLDVTERFYKEEPIYDKVTETTTTYISNMEDVPKKKKLNIKLSKDTQVFILMVAIIFIFILILPVLSDFIKNIKNN